MAEKRRYQFSVKYELEAGSLVKAFKRIHSLISYGERCRHIKVIELSVIKTCEVKPSVSFYYTWCRRCKEETPHYQNSQKCIICAREDRKKYWRLKKK